MNQTAADASVKVPWAAAGASAWLAVLFLLVYPTCNWLTSLRGHVPSAYMGWERAIPFVPRMIVPYLSIDVFFLLAPLVLPTPERLRAYTIRMTAAVILCGACFLLFPLRAAFEVPPVSGILGTVFGHFRHVDLPFNECPSLHIASLVLIADVFLRRLRGVWRVLAAGWFLLIGVSPVLVYQHHLIDIVCGLLLGALCLHFIRERPQRLVQPVTPNYRMASYYAAGAGLLAGLGIGLSGWGFWLLWPAFALLCASAAYSGLGPGIYGKHDGKLPWTAWLILWPLLLGQWASLWYYARRSAPYDRLTERVYIGRWLTPHEARELKALGVTAVLDLTCEFSERAALRELAYLALPVLDLTAPTMGQIEQALAFIGAETKCGTVYIHCKAGYSRTAAVAGAWLLAAGQAASPDEALAALRRSRRGMIVRRESERAVREFAWWAREGGHASVPKSLDGASSAGPTKAKVDWACF